MQQQLQKQQHHQGPTHVSTQRAIQTIAVCAVFISAASTVVAQNVCSVQTGALRTPVIELYTSEGCSSCPPADQWLSRFKAAQPPSAVQANVQPGQKPGGQTQAQPGSQPVVQAFHVGYWDYIGWADRFATAAHTQRQRDVASRNQLRGIYTPQAVLDGRDWADWHSTNAAAITSRSPLQSAAAAPARAQITLRQLGPDQFEALVVGKDGAPRVWSAYWTVTEHDHSSRVKSGENAGEFLKHDFVVRQYVPVGDHSGDGTTAERLTLRSIAATPGHARQVNLVVFDPQSGATLQAASLGC